MDKARPIAEKRNRGDDSFCQSFTLICLRDKDIGYFFEIQSIEGERKKSTKTVQYN